MSERAPRIQTRRLILRRFEPGDIDAFLAYRQDTEVERYQGWGAYSLDQAMAFVRSQAVAAPGVPGGWFQFAAELQETATLVGDVGLHTLDDPRFAEIGYTLARPYHRRGLATEMVSAVLDFAFETLGVHRVTALIDTRNAPSIRLAERLGLRREGHLRAAVPDGDGWADEYLYALLNDEWRRARSPSPPVA